ITYSAFYVGFFTLLATAVVLLALSVLTALGRRPWRSWAPLWQRGWAVALGFALCMPVVLYTYGPSIASGRQRDVQDLTAYALSPRDLVNVDSHNIMWGHLLAANPTGGTGEGTTVPTPLLLVIGAALLIWGLLKVRQLPTWGLVGLATLAAGFTLWLSPLRIGAFFPWSQTIYRIPGGSAIRAIGRIEVLATPLLMVGIALVLGTLWSIIPRTRVTPAVIAVIALILGALVIEQANLSDRQLLDRGTVADLAQISAPPGQCRSFALTAAADPTDVSHFAMVTAATQAAFVAQNVAVPTWNGYSGLTPEGWNMRYVGGSAYRSSALAWGADHHLLETACGLDLATKSWLDPAQFNAYLRK
ncbi:MAG: hypothetical protein WCI74_20620, partial [Actinomycetes bacterium]